MLPFVNFKMMTWVNITIMQLNLNLRMQRMIRIFSIRVLNNKAENNKDLIYIIQSRQAAFRLPVILLFIFNISLYRGQGYFSPFNYRS